MEILKEHLQDFAEAWNFKYLYGLLAGIDRVTFVKFCRDENKFLESSEFVYDIIETFLEDKNTEEMFSLYYILYCIIQEALKDFCVTFKLSL